MFEDFQGMVPCLLPLLEAGRERDDREFLLLLDALESVLVDGTFSVLRYERAAREYGLRRPLASDCCCHRLSWVSGYRHDGGGMAIDESGRIHDDPRARALAPRLREGVAALDEDEVVALLLEPRLLHAVAERLFRDPCRNRPQRDYAPPHWRMLREGRYADNGDEAVIMIVLGTVCDRLAPPCRSGA